ncbi:zinc-dependent alcohol dehydrogenase family protein [Candidatus Cyanaurora vandensis]|uniref:zinc-dependent alcohol dehydrogenase family protein n=1 Tax=Candidatus Cyanaurora vandensis TaxID=2714958 RepID=UPI00257A7974|nr:zinc-dependent alcohol dehydrogenase family protein [Candidatus Cyanaurora vandensis]
MRAVLLNAPGGDENLQLQTVPDPDCGPTQVLVEIKAAGVNPIDTKLRQRGTFYPEAMPAILGCDGAGVVVAVGREVRRYRVGDAVYFCHGGLGQGGGNYAELIAVEEHCLAPKPASLSFQEAAAVPLVLITAWEALYDRAQLDTRMRVLVHAGAGGVGHLAIQLAHLREARVCTTVGSRAAAEFVTGLGAEEIIFYKETPFVEKVLAWTGGQGVDVALDTVGGAVFGETLRTVTYYGDCVTLLQPPALTWEEARRRNLRISYTLMLTPQLAGLKAVQAYQAGLLAHASQLFDTGKLRIQVSHSFSLAQAGVAHRLLEAGSMIGKIVLVP